MAFIATVQYQVQLSPNTFVVADTSVYASPDAKSNFSARSLQILQSDGSALADYPNPINFPIGGSNTDYLTFTGLTQDVVLQIIMILNPVVVNEGSIYTAETDVATVRFEQQGLFNIQVQRLNIIDPSSLANSQYRTNSIDLIIEAQNAQTAVLYGNYTGGQLALNRTQNIILNTTL